jgi:phosphoribosyl-ATP pyrophosphohydrolase/phosphoribosyl-AMP cyclohydrolase
MRNRSAPLTLGDADSLDWEKSQGLIPAIVQDRATLQVLMLGYMDAAALRATIEGGRVTFFSRSKGRLWTKGETSGDFLENAVVFADCDDDALLVLADPAGPTCHLGTASCFSEDAAPGVGWLARLEQIVAERSNAPATESYTRRLLDEGPMRIAQKVGEEGVETALAGATGDGEALKGEAADLLFHLLVLLQARGVTLEEVMDVLRKRHR